MHPRCPIVVIDSGLGGLTVAAAIRRALPAEDLLYFGDTARVPYGSKSPQTVLSFVRQIVSLVRGWSPKHIVLACNTATAVALEPIAEEFESVSLSGVVEPGAQAAASAAGENPRPNIGVIATEATIRSKAYERAILRRLPHARLVCRATPLLVPLIEEGRGEDDPVVKLALRQYLEPMLADGLDVLVLGCTHYPIYRRLIEAAAGEGVAVIDSAQQCAEDVARLLRVAGLCRSRRQRGGFWSLVTDSAPRFAQIAARFLGGPIEPPVHVPLEDLYAAETRRPLRLRSAG